MKIVGATGLVFLSSMKTEAFTGLGGLWALEWAWHSTETNLRCAGISGNYLPNPSIVTLIVPEIRICMPNSCIVACIVSEISALIRTDGGLVILIKNIYTLWGGSVSACYILSDESSIPFCLLHTFRRV